MRFWETREFRRLQIATYRGLYESGFTDIERGLDDGSLFDGIEPGRIFVPRHPRALDECLCESAQVQAATRGIQLAAMEALAIPSIWRGLPRSARRWWRLCAGNDWSPARAARAVGVSKRVSGNWGRTIKARIAARR